MWMGLFLVCVMRLDDKMSDEFKEKDSCDILKKQPLISVVTVVFNEADALEKTIVSVVNQLYKNVELIIIDGGSSDGTLEVIRKYEKDISCWVSESDHGIYDAMNKGIAIASGRWINFLNAGDSFLNLEVLRKINFNRTESAVLVGNVKYESGRDFKSLRHPMMLKNSIHHQGAFYSRKSFNDLGLFIIHYRILADYHFNFKCLKNGFIFVPLNLTVALCSDRGVSDTPNWINYKEEIEIRREFVNSALIRFVLGVYSFGKFVVKKALRQIQIQS